MFQASLAGAVLFNPEQQADAAAIASGFAVLLLPYSLVGPFAGVLLDRWSRQRVLVRANLLRSMLVCVAAAVLLTFGPTCGLFYVLALSVVGVNRFFLSALSASLPHVVPRTSLVTANSLTTTSGFLAALTGGAIGLTVRAIADAGLAGDALVALCAAAGYLLSSFVPRGFDRHALGPDAPPSYTRAADAAADVLRGLVAGARHVAGRKPAAHALLAIGAHRFFYGISTIATLLLYRNYFPDSTWLRAGLPGMAQVLACGGVGVILAALLTPAITRRLGTPRWIWVVLAGASVTEIVLGLPYRQAPLLAAAALLGFAAQATKICVDSILQSSVDDAVRGRVFAFYDTLFNLTFVSAAVAAAIVLPPSGKSYPVLLTIAAGYGLIALCYALASRRYPDPTGRTLPTSHSASVRAEPTERIEQKAPVKPADRT